MPVGACRVNGMLVRRRRRYARRRATVDTPFLPGNLERAMSKPISPRAHQEDTCKLSERVTAAECAGMAGGPERLPGDALAGAMAAQGCPSTRK